jgi:hypothetical protein
METTTRGATRRLGWARYHWSVGHLLGACIALLTYNSAYTLCAIIFELLANPSKLRILKEELATALPSSSTPPSSAALEQLPYLTAVIQEGLRLHPGALSRMTRVSPDKEMVRSRRLGSFSRT